MPVGAGVERVPGIVRVHQVDPAGRGQHPLHQTVELLSPGVGVTGVQAEADGVPTVGAAHRIPESGQLGHTPGHRLVPAGGVLDEDRHGGIKLVHRLAPVVEPDLLIVGGEHVPAVHHHADRADLGSGVDLLLHQLPAGNADPVVRGRHVQHVRRMHHERDPGLCRRVLERRRTTGIVELVPLPCLRVPDEDLCEVRPPCLRFGDRVALSDVCSQQCHGPSVAKPSDTADGHTCPAPAVRPARSRFAVFWRRRASVTDRLRQTADGAGVSKPTANTGKFPCLGHGGGLAWWVHGKGGDPRVNSYRTREVTAR